MQAWIQDAWVDAVGNVHGRLNGSEPALPALLMGSHYDTVLDAGRCVGVKRSSSEPEGSEGT